MIRILLLLALIAGCADTTLDVAALDAYKEAQKSPCGPEYTISVLPGGEAQFTMYFESASGEHLPGQVVILADAHEQADLTVSNGCPVILDVLNRSATENSVTIAIKEGFMLEDRLDGESTPRVFGQGQVGRIETPPRSSFSIRLTPIGLILPDPDPK